MFSVLGSSPRSRQRRRITFATTCLLAASCLSLTTTSADAVLTRVGPTDPATHFPSFYTDTSGLSLQPCLDGPPLCVGTEAELLDAGADGEGFYYSAQTSVGGFDMAFDLEMAFLDAVDAPIVFQRLQFASRGGVLEPEGTYTIDHPYGTSTCTADASGNIANNACRTEVGGTAGNDFAGALGGPIGPFLTWDTFGAATGGPPAGYIGDGDSTAHKVLGGPVRNFVQVTGPGVLETTDLFNVYGKLAPGPMGSTSQRSIDFGSLTAPATRHITYRSVGTQPIGVSSVTASGPFTISANTCNGVTLASGAQCDIDVTFTPTPGVASSGAISIADETGTKVIPLTGRGRLGVASVSRTSLVLADTKVGEETSNIVTVTNTGDLDLTVAQPSLDGTDRSDFRLGLIQDGCAAGATLAPGAACNLRVVFSPRASGIRSAVLNVATSVGTPTVNLAGTGIGTGPATGTGVGTGTGTGSGTSTSTSADVVAPVLKRQSPAAGAKRVKRGANVVVEFSETVSGVDRRSFRLADAKSGNVVRAKVTNLSGNVWQLDPKGKLKKDATYRVRVRSVIHDPAGNRLRTTPWKFHTM